MEMEAALYDITLQALQTYILDILVVLIICVLCLLFYFIQYCHVVLVVVTDVMQDRTNFPKWDNKYTLFYLDIKSLEGLKD